MENISIADLARNIERLDMNFLKRAMVRHEASGLAILRHPLEINDIGVIHEGHVERVLNLLKISYSHLIVDLSKSLLPTDLMALRMADIDLADGATGTEQPAERGAADPLHEQRGEPRGKDPRGHQPGRRGIEAMEEGISLKKAEEVIGKPIFWQVPNDSKAMIAARVAGAPLVIHNPKCRAQMAIQGLAQAIIGKPAVGSSTEN